MLAKQDKLNKIRQGFSVFQTCIQPVGALNQTDINVTAEDFVGDVRSNLLE
jgi:hypothetical protein